MGEIMDIDKEIQSFKEDLESGKITIEILPNNDVDYKTKEERDLTAFLDYLESDDYSALAGKVLGNGNLG